MYCCRRGLPIRKISDRDEHSTFVLTGQDSRLSFTGDWVGFCWGYDRGIAGNLVDEGHTYAGGSRVRPAWGPFPPVQN